MLVRHADWGLYIHGHISLQHLSRVWLCCVLDGHTLHCWRLCTKGVSHELQWPPSLGTGLAALGALMGLRQLFLEADMCDSRLRSLRLGANVMVTMEGSEGFSQTCSCHIMGVKRMAS